MYICGIGRQVTQQLGDAVRRARQCRGRAGAPDLALVIDGRALAVVLEPDWAPQLLELGVACKVGPSPIRTLIHGRGIIGSMAC